MHVDPSYPLPATPAFIYGYEDDSIGLLKTVTGPSHTVTNVWEPNRDVLDTKTNADRASTPATVSAFNYGVNNLGQRTGVATSGSAFSGGYAIGWAYNPSGELKEEDFGANQTSETRDRAFQYDAIGNREKTANGLLADLPVSPNYTANSLNQYTVANGITLPTTPAAHDADGNAKAWNIRNPLATGSSSLAACTFTWDAENRLTEVRNSGGTVIATYAYDFQSRRIRKTVTGGEDVAFFYDGWNCIAEYQVGGASTPQVRYTWGLDLSGSMQGAGGVGGLLVVTKSSTSYYPTFDGNGNVSEYLNSGGASVAHFEYDAFGNVVNFTESGAGLAATFRHRFSTKPQDTETGLLYYGYRCYDPLTGRWPSRDPIEESGGVNLYSFVGNDGVSRWDFLGLAAGQLYDSPYAAFKAASDDTRNSTAATVVKGLAELKVSFALTEFDLYKLLTKLDDGETAYVKTGDFSVFFATLSNDPKLVGAIEEIWIAGIEHGTIVYCDPDEQKWSYIELIPGILPTRDELMGDEITGGGVQQKDLIIAHDELVAQGMKPLGVVHSHNIKAGGSITLNKKTVDMGDLNELEQQADLSPSDQEFANELKIPICAVDANGRFKCTGGQPR